MKTITICPACSTAFLVDRTQLEARDGKVRCGACRTVFDARASLHIIGDDAKVASVEPATKAATVASSASPAPAAPKPVPAPRSEGAKSRDKPKAQIPKAKQDTQQGAFAVPDFSAERRRRKKHEWLWALACIPLLLALAAQAAYYYRSEVAVTLPGVRPALDVACVHLGCEIALPRHAEWMSIEGSDLQAEGGGVLTLSATLRNRAAFEQALPAVELTLTDVREQPILRRVLQPQDYLGPLTPSAPGIPAGAEIQLRVPFDVADVHPAGYRLYVFYP